MAQGTCAQVPVRLSGAAGAPTQSWHHCPSVSITVCFIFTLGEDLLGHEGSWSPCGRAACGGTLAQESGDLGHSCCLTANILCGFVGVTASLWASNFHLQNKARTVSLRSFHRTGVGGS